MRLLCVTSSWPRWSGDLSGVFVEEWATRLRQEGVEVYTLAWRGPGARPVEGVRWVPYAPPALEGVFFGAGAPENLSQAPWLAALVPGALAAMWRALDEEVRRWRPDLIVGHWALPGGALARAIGRRHGIPSAVVAHSGGVAALQRLPAPVGRRLAGWLLDGPTVAVSARLADALAALAPARPRAEVLPMGFWPAAARVDSGPRDEALMMGRLVPIKGVAVWLEAMRRLGDDAPTLHIAGDGPERARLERMARGLPVTFHGVVTGPARDALLARCGWVIAPSLRLGVRGEGAPTGLFTACHAGLIPLVGDIDDAEALLHTPSLQRLPRPPDPDAWARQARALLKTSQAHREAMRAHAVQIAAARAWPVLGARWAYNLWRASGDGACCGGERGRGERGQG